jgi:hypothetical protein
MLFIRSGIHINLYPETEDVYKRLMVSKGIIEQLWTRASTAPTSNGIS